MYIAPPPNARCATHHCGPAEDVVARSCRNIQHATRQVADIAREVQMSHTLEGHPNILPMTATYEDTDTVWIVLVRIFALCVRVFALLVPVCASVARFSALSVRLFESSVPLFEPLER